MKARVTVTLKSGVLDPQGKAIEGALKSLGVSGVASVRQGKVFDIEIEGGDKARAEAALKDAAEKLLANTVIENYRIEVVVIAMKSAVVVFPGINRERDMARTLKLISGREPAMVWHAETSLPAGTDLVVIPGGFSYGDYLRCGAIAARAPIMDAVRAHAGQRRAGARRCATASRSLCEAGLLPGVLMRNAQLKFICRDIFLKVERSDTPFTRGYNAGQVIRVPTAHGEGNYVADADDPRAAGGRGPGGVPLHRAGRQPRSAVELQRLHQRHRRHPQRARQRARHDAASGKPR